MLTVTKVQGHDVYTVAGDRLDMARVAHELDLAGRPDFAAAFRAGGRGEVDVVVFSSAMPELRADFEAAAAAAGVGVAYDEEA